MEKRKIVEQRQGTPDNTLRLSDERFTALISEYDALCSEEQDLRGRKIELERELQSATPPKVAASMAEYNALRSQAGELRRLVQGQLSNIGERLPAVNKRRREVLQELRKEGMPLDVSIRYGNEAVMLECSADPREPLKLSRQPWKEANRPDSPVSKAEKARTPAETGASGMLLGMLVAFLIMGYVPAAVVWNLAGGAFQIGFFSLCGWLWFFLVLAAAISDYNEEGSGRQR